jgi:Mg2+ and Co2+ transporter CorA
MAFVDSLLDLRDETDLVYQMSDTRDEMEILSTVLTWQRRILQDLSSVLAATSLADSGDSNWGCKRAVHFIKSSLRTVNSTTSELKRMDKQAKRIYATVTNILDIKQKYANAIEARSVRAGGLTIMVFTVATVFFLPASFIISFFGLNLSSLRHEHGNISLSPGFVCRWVLGLGLGVALLYLAVAFQFRNILRWLGINKIRRWWTKTYDASKSADAKYRNVSKAAGSSSRVSRISTGMSFNSRQRRRPSSVDGRGEV